MKMNEFGKEECVLLLTTTKVLNEMRIGTTSAMETSKEHNNQANMWFFTGAVNASEELLREIMKVSTVDEYIEVLYGKLFEYKQVGYGYWQAGRIKVVKYIIERLEHGAT